jgi:hypothetical protein
LALLALQLRQQPLLLLDGALALGVLLAPTFKPLLTLLL